MVSGRAETKIFQQYLPPQHIANVAYLLGVSCSMGYMETPFGKTLGVFEDKQSFYDKFPETGEGWNLQEYPGKCPLGITLFDGNPEDDPRWVVTFCAPRQEVELSETPAGEWPVIAFDRNSGDIYLLAESMPFDRAKSSYDHLSYKID